MPEPTTDPNLPHIKRVATHALLAGFAITLLKFGIYAMTNSVAVLSDALESVINIVAAGAMLYAIWYSNRPADRDHPYGHGKIEFMVVGLEGWLILTAGVWIGYEAISRFINPVEPQRLGIGMGALAVVGILSALLAFYVWHAGRKYDSAPLKADGRHLFTDVFSTVGVLGGLMLVRATGYTRLDPLVAIVMACIILYASWRLLWQSFQGLMDRSDPDDAKAIDEILQDELAQKNILGYHKVRHRHNGPFHWVDMHLHVDGNMTVTEGHELASRIERRIEIHLGQANATAHLEPYQEQVQAIHADSPIQDPPNDEAASADEDARSYPVQDDDKRDSAQL